MSENENIIFGIEKSGHFFHRDFFGLDNGILTFIKIVDILNASGKSLSELAQQYHTYENTPVINLTVEDPDRCLEHVKSAFSHYTISELDGVTIESDDFRFTVRKSNTEPLLRIAGEAKTTELLEDIQQKILDVIQ